MNVWSSICLRRPSRNWWSGKGARELIACRISSRSSRSRARCGSWSPPQLCGQTIAELLPALEAGDTIIDGGNSYSESTISAAPMNSCRKASTMPTSAPAVASGGLSAAIAVDDRWPRARGEASRSDLQSARARRRLHFANPRPRGPPTTADSAIFIAGRTGPDISSRWFITVSSRIMAAYAEGLDILRGANVGVEEDARSRRGDNAAPESGSLQI